MRGFVEVAFAVVLSAMFVQAVPAFAQEAPSAGGAPAESSSEAVPVIANYAPRDYIPLSAITADGEVQVSDEVVFQSMLFTAEEINTVISALNRKGRTTSSNVGTGFVGGPLAGTDAQAAEDGESAEARPYYPPIPTKRIISVSGLLYRSPGDWIVWLNGHKLVPGARLPELVDIKVERDRVHLKWFDIGMAKILSITLRPRQTYDITSGVMLTTTGGDMQ